MKVVLLAGGFGTRISEESYLKPKPMIEIGGMPILWHIMKIYSYYGYNEFIVCCGYKQEMIKKWFADYFLNTSNVTFDFKNNNKMFIHNNYTEPWKVTVVDTGLHTLTGGRIKRIQEYIQNEPFMLTYGDGVSNVNIQKLVEYHSEHDKIATLTAVLPEGRFGILDLEGNRVCSFREKNKVDMGWINGGFMVFSPQIFKYIEGDMIMLEKEPLEMLAKKGELMCYKHNGFWQCMDTLRDKERLEKMWDIGKAEWKVWDK